MGTMMDILAVGGAVSLFVTPAALVVIVGMGRTLRKLEERNAAQGVTIAGLQARLERYGRKDSLKSCQNGTVGREVGSEVGGSTSTAPNDAVRPVSYWDR